MSMQLNKQGGDVMKETEFNLLDEPWIRVIDEKCTEKEISLLDFFEKAHMYSDFAGELPTQDVQIMRIIISILTVVITRYNPKTGELSTSNDGEELMSRWKYIWDKNQFPYEIVKTYLEQYRDRFWLFHPKYPFMQMHLAKMGSKCFAAKLNGMLSESNNKSRLFPVVSGERKESLSYAEAVRWLMYTVGYDDTAVKKSEYAKKNKIKVLSIGVGWLGELGIITLEGRTLFETVMLNTVLFREDSEAYGKPKPIWEKDVYDGDDIMKIERVRIPMPDNLPELYTIQSRHVILNRKDGRVDKANVIGGEFFDKENAYMEPMTVWRSKDLKKDTDKFEPKKHDISKQFWREFANVFPRSGEGSRRPGVISWFDTLVENECISEDYPFRAKISSVKYDNSSANTVTNVFSDSLSMNGALISEQKKAWQNCIIEAINLTNDIAKTLKTLAKDIYIASGGNNSEDKAWKAVQNIPEQYYYNIDKEFRLWLKNINPQKDDLVEVKNEWSNMAKRMAERMGDDIIKQAGPAAYIGKEVEDKVYSAAQAKIRFKTSLAAKLKRGGVVYGK